MNHNTSAFEEAIGSRGLQDDILNVVILHSDLEESLDKLVSLLLTRSLFSLHPSLTQSFPLP